MDWLTEDSDRAHGQIPFLEESEIESLLTKYQAVVQKDDGAFYKIKHPNPYNVSYLWNATGHKWVKFTPMHTSEGVFPCAYYGLFKPSLSEVMRNRPDQVIMFPEINAFWLDTDKLKIFSTGSAQLVPIVWGKID